MAIWRVGGVTCLGLGVIISASSDRRSSRGKELPAVVEAQGEAGECVPQALRQEWRVRGEGKGWRGQGQGKMTVCTEASKNGFEQCLGGEGKGGTCKGGRGEVKRALLCAGCHPCVHDCCHAGPLWWFAACKGALLQGARWCRPRGVPMLHLAAANGT